MRRFYLRRGGDIIGYGTWFDDGTVVVNDVSTGINRHTLYERLDDLTAFLKHEEDSDGYDPAEFEWLDDDKTGLLMVKLEEQRQQIEQMQRQAEYAQGQYQALQRESNDRSSQIRRLETALTAANRKGYAWYERFNKLAIKHGLDPADWPDESED